MIRQNIPAIRDILIAIEISCQDQMRKFKKTAISIFGTTTLIIFGGTSVATQLIDKVQLINLNIVLASFISGLIVFAIFLAIGCYWTWEFLTFDFDVPINPMYEDIIEVEEK